MQLVFLATHVCYPLGASIDLGPEAKLSVVMLRSGLPAGVLLLLIQSGQPFHLVQKALPGMRLLGGRQHVGGCACLWTERALLVLLQTARRDSNLVLDCQEAVSDALVAAPIVHCLTSCKQPGESQNLYWTLKHCTRTLHWTLRDYSIVYFKPNSVQDSFVAALQSLI